MCTLTLGWPKCHFLRGERICINDFSLNRNVCVCAHACSLGHMQLFATLWSVAHQGPLSMGFPRQEYCSVLPFPTLGNLPNPGTEPVSPVSPALAGRFFTTIAVWEAPTCLYMLRKKVKVKVARSCLTLQPMDYRVHGFVQARILEWVAFAFSNPVIEPRSPAL